MIVRRRKTWTQDKVILDNGQKWWVHKRDICAGSNCAIHNPSDHPLKDATLIIRGANPFDIFGLKPYGFIERVCEHKIAHSDPDSVAFYDSIGHSGTNLHACDGCCTGKYEEVQSGNSI